MAPFSSVATVLTPHLSRRGLQYGSGEQCGCDVIGSGETFSSLLPVGYGGLGLSIEGPSKVDINCEDMEDGTCKVTYCPTEPGTYIINIKFADKHVPGKARGCGLMGTDLVTRQGTRDPDSPLLPHRKPLHCEGNW